MIQLIKATLEDLSEITSLLGAYEDYEYELDHRQLPQTKQQLKKQTTYLLKEGNVQFSLIKEDEETIGAANWEIRKRVKGNAGIIHNIFIKKESRNKGTGRKTLHELFTHFKKEGCTSVSTFIRPYNKQSQYFWKKQGFDLDLGYSAKKRLI